MTTIFGSTSPQMEQIIKQLAAKYSVDLFQKGAQLSLDMPTRRDRWLIANLDGERISLTRCLVEEDDCLAPDLDMVFALTPAGWELRALLHADDVWDAYVQTAKATGFPVYDDEGGIRFDSFTEYWAQQFQEQGWLTHSRRVPDSFWPPAEDEPSGRMAGCESTNHDQCYGELWQCAACRKTVCYAEGTDDHRELCVTVG